MNTHIERVEVSDTPSVRYLRQRSPSGYPENDLWYELPHGENLMHGTVSLSDKKETGEEEE